MSKASIQVDSIQSDSDLSLQLSDASSLSSDSDLPESKRLGNNKKPIKKTKRKQKKKKKTAKKDAQKYCICRKGYDGKEFMIECEDCKEWFHGACVGLKPNSVSDHYACSSCLSKRKPVSAGKTLIPPPPKWKKSAPVLPVLTKPPPQPIPVISKLLIQDYEEDEDLDDICILCDGDCTCNVQDTPSLPTPSPPTPSPQQPIQTKITIPLPKKSSKAISNKKSKKSNTWTIRSMNDDDSDDDSNISTTDSDDSDSDDDDTVVERIGIDAKKAKSKAPNKKTTPKKSTHLVRRGKSKTVLATIVRQKAPPSCLAKKGKGKKMAVKYPSSDDDDGDGLEDSDEELIVDDLDDLLETMSPLSEHSSNESDSSLLGSEEFFTDDDASDLDQNKGDTNDGSSVTMSPYAASYTSSTHLDSGDDEDIENVETQKIIKELTLDSDEEADDVDSDILDEEGGMFVEDEYEDEDQEDEDAMQHTYYARNNSHWSSSSEEEEEEEFDYTITLPSEEDGVSVDSADDDKTNPLLPLLDSEGNLYDSMAAAFMQALAENSNSNARGDTTTGANTPGMGEDYQLSAFELTNALSALSAETSRQYNDILFRRPSLPSSAVSAARRMRGSQDFSTSEALRALSALVSDELSLALQPIDEVEDAPDNNKQQPEPPTLSTVKEKVSTSNILPTQLALSLSTDLKLQEQLLDIFQGRSNTIVQDTADQEDKSKQRHDQEAEKVQSTCNSPTNNHINTSASALSASVASSTSTKHIHSSRHILPKPSGSGSYPMTISSLEQQIQEALMQSLSNGNNDNKRKATHGLENEKKRRSSRSNSLGSSANQHHSQPLVETTSFSTPASPAAMIDELEDMNMQMDSNQYEDMQHDLEAAVSMDDLVDTSQLYTRSSSRSPSPEVEDTYSRDLSRWQRIPIGAFRLMRSKNKLWLER